MPPNMSLESAMDEERREVMNILEGRPAGYRSGRSPPPQPIRTGSPAAPVRSMLDIGPATVRHASIAGTNSGVTAGPLRSAAGGGSSMLNPYAPAPARQASHDSTAASSTSEMQVGSESPQLPAEGSTFQRPHAGSDASPTLLPYSREQFDMSSTVAGPARPKRVSQGGRRSMAQVMRGQDLDTVAIGRNHEKHLLPASRSPSSRSRHGKGRTDSPAQSRLNTNSFNPLPTPGKFISESGKVIDLNNAYRKLSDAHLLKSGSRLSGYTRDPEARARHGSGEMVSPDGDVRLAKDAYDPEDGEDACDESSDDGRSSDEDLRGRRRSRPDSDEDDDEASEAGGSQRSSLSRNSPKSLLAAAEEERLDVSSKYAVRSLLEPTVTVTGPGGEKLAVRRAGVHPNTSYNAQLSRSGSPANGVDAGDSDSDPDRSDLRKAQNLAILFSPVDTSKTHTAIRTLVRGEYSTMQHEGETGQRRLRNYLVATDLSSEAAYALEWTIGTVLRDGDTVLALYAIDGGDALSKAGGEASGAGSADGPGVEIGEGARAIQESAVAIGRLTEASKTNANIRFHSPATRPGLAATSRPSSSDARHMTKLQKERVDAVYELQDVCLKFLRKTTLQVRIALEVIHCKSPKNLITEAIDVINPTLVILGSRGRSALKGVLLGSFSNYLVTKSSVPVMVARKKLQKPSSKYRLRKTRLANNIAPTRSLADAKID